MQFVGKVVICFREKREFLILRIVKMFRDSADELKSVKNLCIMSLLLALRVCLNFLTLPLSDLCHISFLFIVAGISGGMFGPFVATLFGGIGDILSYVIHPMGCYFFGFTVSAMVAGLIYGLILYKNKFSVFRIVVAEVVVDIIVNVLMNTLWISILFGMGFWELLVSVRIPKNLITIPVSLCIFILLSPLINKFIKRVAVR